MTWPTARVDDEPLAQLVYVEGMGEKSLVGGRNSVERRDLVMPRPRRVELPRRRRIEDWDRLLPECNLAATRQSVIASDRPTHTH